MEFTKEHIHINTNSKILEIGSGACGILTYLKTTNYRYAIDPLESYYSTVKNFTDKRDKHVKYITAIGENVPVKDSEVDFIIMDNVLDHCANPQIVLQEVKRVIKKNGILYFKQNTYHFWGKLIRFVMEKFIIDKGHPHTFSKRDIVKLFQEYEFEILKSKRTGYLSNFKRELLSKLWVDKIKAALFVTRDKVTYVIKIH